jgi:hypothetical protein
MIQKLIIEPKTLDKYVGQLTDISKSALPNAIRNTLNSAAFDVKKNTMPKTSKVFTQRRITFFKANSSVDTAKGKDVSKMASIVGFRSRNDGKGHSVEDLEEQEHGGKIKDRDYIATPFSRSNNSWEKNVRSGLKMKDLKSKLKETNLINVYGGKFKKQSKKQKFIRASIVASKTGKLVLGGKLANGSRTISRIDNFSKVGNKITIKRTALYTYKKGRVAPIKATNFMKRASMETSLSLNKWFIINAERQIEYALNK